MTVNESCEQPKICEKVFEGIDERFKVSNHRIEDLENKTEEINGINNTLAKLEILISLQREDSIKRDKSIAEMSKTQIEITNTLKDLANNLNKTEENVDKLSKKVDEINNDNNIKINSILKYIIMIVISSGITYWLTQAFAKAQVVSTVVTN